jgi:hypothetical protein
VAAQKASNIRGITFVKQVVIKNSFYAARSAAASERRREAAEGRRERAARWGRGPTERSEKRRGNADAA